MRLMSQKAQKAQKRFAPRFDPDSSKQGVEESNPNLKYMRLKISLTTRSSVRLWPLRLSTGPRKLFDLHRKISGESSAKMNIANPNPNSAPLPWRVSLALLDRVVGHKHTRRSRMCWSERQAAAQKRGAAGLLTAQEAMFCSRIPLLVLVVGCLNPNSGVRTVLE